MNKISWVFLFLGGWSFCVGCGAESEPPKEVVVKSSFSVQLTSSETVVKTTTLRLAVGRGDPFLEGQTIQLVFEGKTSREERVSYTYPARVNSEGEGLTIEMEASQTLWGDLLSQGQPREVFQGDVVVLVSSRDETFRSKSEPLALNLLLDANPKPVMASPGDLGTVWPGQTIELSGERMLSPDEGVSWVVVESGSIEREGVVESLDGVRFPLTWSGQREKANFEILPEQFGLRKGQFSLTYRLENALKGESEVYVGSTGLSARGGLGVPRIDGISKMQASRGEFVRITGRGFTETDNERSVGMLLRFSGTFRPDATPNLQIDYRADRAVERAPYQIVDHTVIRQDIWYEEGTSASGERVLEGLGGTPGVFEGRVEPVVFAPGEEVVGEGVPLNFRVLPSKQVVYVKYLPSFDTSLERYGLRNVAREIKERISYVLIRDYDGYNLEFRDRQPDDYIDYMTLEIGGPDPTGQFLFGYDNSSNGVPKDIGNLALRDYLGGFSLTNQMMSFEAYGGVFVESFVIYSATLSPRASLAAPGFDMTLGPFMPELGGSPVKALEWPVGGRTSEIAAAILMLGNLIGSTATHEIGHSLGLPYIEGEMETENVIYHNQGAGEKPYIMDSGSDRPFEERSEFGGVPPAIFSQANRDYLKRVLPK